MRISQSKAIFGIAALATMLAFGTTTSAAPISKCDAAKKKCIGKYVAAQLGCHAKAESKGLEVEALCLAKGVAKITGAGKGCFDKNEAKVPNDCSITGDTPAELSAADAFILDIVDDVDPSYPTPTLTKCGAARKKCVGKKASGLMGCSAKASKDGIGDPACAPKIQDKFDLPGKGCDVKAVFKGPDCLGTATTASLEAKTDAWSAGAEARIEHPCGNGVIDPGEFCDPGNPSAPGATCGPTFPCNPTTCNCACPTKIVFSGDATAPETILDIGWTGISHRAPIIGNGDVTMSLSGCSLSDRPCGTCTVSGPIANPSAGAGQLDNQRCSHDSSIKCTNAATCGGGNSCEFYFGAPQPLSAGGITTCVVNQFNGSLSGTANVLNGEIASLGFLNQRVYSGIAIDNPCPRCSDAGGINDGVNGGTCTDGPNIGDPCDANGSVPLRTDFGRTSLDCPPNPAGIIATQVILGGGGFTDQFTRTVSAASPNCQGEPGEKCLCDTCNSLAAELCDDNFDCSDPPGPIGPICGGRRCIGGINAGAACTVTSECPGGGICGRPGEPAKPSSCLDDTTTVGILDCSDTAPVDGEGECTSGPVDGTCTGAHEQRGCSVDGDCAPGGTCLVENRRCFLTGGFTGKVGSNTLIAEGMEDTPMADTWHPTLGNLFSCVGPTSLSSVNGITGLPGPGRSTIKGTAVALP